MAATRSTDLRFEPKVWSEYTKAYFDKKLVYGTMAVRNDSLTAEGTGTVVNFPYYQAISGAETPAEDESLTVDRLSDDSFAAAIFEVGKAVGIKDRPTKTTGDSKQGMYEEATSQIGRVMAEEVDEILNREITAYDNSRPLAGPHEIGLDRGLYRNMLIGYLATEAANTMNVRAVLQAKITAFGDKEGDAGVMFMHSLQFLDFLQDPTAGYLKADANSPFAMTNGYQGRIGNMAIVTVDSVPKLPMQIDGKDAYLAHFHKASPYGIIEKADIMFETDRDILAREGVVTATQWYGVTSFDRKIHARDNKSAGMITTVNHTLVR